MAGSGPSEVCRFTLEFNDSLLNKRRIMKLIVLGWDY